MTNIKWKMENGINPPAPSGDLQVPSHQPGRALKVHCIINSHSGAGAAAYLAAVEQAFAAPNRQPVESVVEVCKRPRDLLALVRGAVDAGADIVAAGGGDGTVSTVANLLVGTPVALGVLPLGTLNHFAKDLGLPLDLRGAVEVICRGRTASVDVGEVNGHCFVNNSSIGAYSEMIRIRERWRPKLGKWLALVISAITVIRRFPILRLDLEGEGRRLRRFSPLLFVGNNVYGLKWPDIGARHRLDQGCLTLLLMREASRLALLRSALRVLRGQLHLAPEIEASYLKSLTVRSHRSRLRVAVDGEMLTLKPPLHYRIRPQALTVCVPPPRQPA